MSLDINLNDVIVIYFDDGQVHIERDFSKDTGNPVFGDNYPVKVFESIDAAQEYIVTNKYERAIACRIIIDAIASHDNKEVRIIR